MTQPFRYAHAAASDWQAAAKACVAQLSSPPPEAMLGFLYATDHLADHMGEIVAYLQHHTGVPHWVGTVGLGINSTGVEYYDEPALAVLVTELPETSFKVITGIGSPADTPRRETLADAHFGIVHGDPRNNRLPELITEFAASMEGGFLVGGLTSSRSESVQVADGLLQGGLSGVVFSPEVAVATRLTQGCTPTGPIHEITECERNIVIGLDGRPALEVLKDDIGEVLARDLNRVNGYIFAGLPIPNSDTGDYLVRNLLGFDTQNKLIAVGEMLEPGSTLMFCRRDGMTAQNDLNRILDELKDGLDTPPRGGLYFSCLGRGANMFGPNSEELRIIQDALGDVPLAGFFANGEISHDRLYGYTGVLTLFT